MAKGKRYAEGYCRHCNRLVALDTVFPPPNRTAAPDLVKTSHMIGSERVCEGSLRPPDPLPVEPLFTVDEQIYNFGDVPKHLARKLAEERAAEEGPATAAVTVPGMTGAARQYADGDTWPYGAGGPLDAPEGENCD